jgi:hypothetical protein
MQVNAALSFELIQHVDQRFQSSQYIRWLELLSTYPSTPLELACLPK